MNSEWKQILTLLEKAWFQALFCLYRRI